MPDLLPRPPRADAAENRGRILDAARALFATEGITVPMREIARRAGVGPATLYRHFPTKEILATAAFAEQLRACRAIVEQAGADPDPWRGFRTLIEEICALHARSRGFTEAFTATFPDAADLGADRAAALRAVAGLAVRAQRSGRLRADFTVDDLMLVLSAHRGIGAAGSARFASLMIQAFRAP
ncbi:helix-turn-helix domain-containing protein [Nocardia sp. NPDC050697]|uniref:TetR/AcrR family transcriptional regulator n=1 Tax=Nocardia sp. NPDC050697 TaxID=3155158 RepID=UPI0033EE8456